MADFVDFVFSKLPGPWSKPSSLAAGFFGVLCGDTGNRLAQGLSIAVRMPLLKDSESPDDVLPLIGDERTMPRYPIETPAQYRARLISAWDTFGAIGEPTIPAQFALAGYPGVQIQFKPAELGPNGEAAPYWSQFWLYFPHSSGHPVTTDGAHWGSFNWGDGTLYGLGVTIDFYVLIHGIVRLFKPSRWICRGFIFELADTSLVEIAFGI